MHDIEQDYLAAKLKGELRISGYRFSEWEEGNWQIIFEQFRNMTKKDFIDATGESPEHIEVRYETLHDYARRISK